MHSTIVKIINLMLIFYVEHYQEDLIFVILGTLLPLLHMKLK